MDARWQPVINQLTNPGMRGGSPGGVLPGWTGAAYIDGEKALMAAASYSDNIAVTPGRRVSARMKLRAPSAGAWRIQIRETLGGLFGARPVLADLSRTFTAGETVNIDLTGVLSTGSDGARLYVQQAGIELHEAICVLDRMPVAYGDGNTPGWRWLGTANASKSVGYPRPA